MPLVRFSFTGLLDIISGIFLYFTVSPIPVTITTLHAGFLVYKGSGTLIQPLPLGMPVFILGNAADLLSAAILLVGNPPFLGDYKIFLAGFLLLKGLMGFLSMMKM
jgi:hypothetical protein